MPARVIDTTKRWKDAKALDPIPSDVFSNMQSEFIKVQSDIVWYVIRRKQFSVIGLPYPGDSFFTRKEWWRYYTWNLAQEKEFRDFFVEYAGKYKPAREILGLHRVRPRKKELEKLAEGYCANFGWPYDDATLNTILRGERNARGE